MLRLLRDNPPLRRFFVAFFGSQVGTGAAYVALLLVAYQRLHSGWAISLVLLGEFVPGILLAPLFGSFADRFSRRRLVVCADLMRALCFVAIAVVPSFAATVVFALLAGVGTALFRPAINAALPGLVPAERRSELTAIFYASINTGLMLGPAVAAGLLLITTAPAVLVLNAVSFVVSAVLLAGVDLGPWKTASGAESAGPPDPEPASVWAQTREGARAAVAMPGVAVLMTVGALVVLTGAMFNVLAPLFATGPLHADGSGYSVLMALYGLGMVAGSWTNARAGSDIGGLRRRWLVGIGVSGVAMAVAALAPNLPLALVAFTFIGLGENLLVGPEMRLMQEMVAERMLGRVFGLKDVLENIAFVAAFVGAGALLTVAGVRAVFAGAGVVTVALAFVGAVAFRTRRVVAARPALETGE
ncbi:MAG TPA: MFS transporter [Solirubrobacteraceae bacterium]|nr:MFS transporter [Solirubrobacteraceae bacterium]